MPESDPSFSHNSCQVKRSDSHAVEKLAWSKNAIDLQMCVKYYCRRRGWGASKEEGWVKPTKPLRVKNTSVWAQRPLKNPQIWHWRAQASSRGEWHRQTTRGQQHMLQQSSTKDCFQHAAQVPVRLPQDHSERKLQRIKTIDDNQHVNVEFLLLCYINKTVN